MFKAPYSVIYSLKGNPQALIQWDTAQKNKSKRIRRNNRRLREFRDAMIDKILRENSST